MNADLALVRHGRTVPQPGVPPARWPMAAGAEGGVRRLADAIRADRDGAFDVVLTSTEPKAVATARLLGSAWGVAVQLGQGLEEHHRGATPVLDAAAWRQTVRRFFAHPDVLVFGSETADEARLRFERAVQGAVRARPGKRLALVTHGTVLALALARANDLDPFAFWASLAMPEALLVRSEDLRLVRRVAGVPGELSGGG